MQTLADRILHWGKVQPDKLAIDDGVIKWGYGELSEEAKLVSRCLGFMGVGAGDRVVILLPKSCEAISAIIGTLLVGATYIPMDLTAPHSRLKSILDDSQPKALITNNETSSWFEELSSLTLNLQNTASVVTDKECRVNVTLKSDAYVLYTSGSTGVPNGVRISHRAMLAFFNAVNSYMGITHSSKCMNTSALYFDVSIADIMLPLYQGASVWLGPEIPMPFRYLGIISSNKITHFCAVGSTLTMLSVLPNFGKNKWSHISCIMTGAEVLNPKTITAWLDVAPESIVLNGYGPTEVTCVCTIFEITRETVSEYTSYPIGVALPSIEVLIQESEDDENPGGELCLAGQQVLNGYLNRHELNEKRFFEKDRQLYYRTGDKVMYDEKGNLCFLGRIDDQVKVRGYRIHLDDVAEPFRCLDGVQEAVAVPLEHVRHGECLAIVVKANRSELSLKALKDLGSAGLPSYMKPKFIGEIRELPLMASGKTDIKMVRARAIEYFRVSDVEVSVVALDAIEYVS